MQWLYQRGELQMSRDRMVGEAGSAAAALFHNKKLKHFVVEAHQKAAEDMWKITSMVLQQHGWVQGLEAEGCSL